MKALWKKLLALVTLPVLLVASFSLDTYADSAAINQTIVEKATFADLYSCYTDTKNGMAQTVNNTQFHADNLASNSSSNMKGLPEVYSSSNGATCRQILNMALNYGGKTIPENGSRSATGTFLEHLGYTKSGGEKSCIRAKLTKHTFYHGIDEGTKTAYTQAVCAETDDNGNITSTSLTVDSSSDSTDKQLVSITTTKSKIKIKYKDSNGKSQTKTIDYADGDSWADISNEIFEVVPDNASWYDSQHSYEYTKNGVSRTTQASSYTLKSRAEAAKKAIQWISNGKYALTTPSGGISTNFSFSEQEKATLYQTYLESKDIYNVEVSCNPSEADQSSYNKNKYNASSNKTGWIHMKKWFDGNGKVNTNCWIRLKNEDKAGLQVHGLNGSAWDGKKLMNFKEVVDALGATTVSELSSEYAEALGTTLTTDDAEAAAEEAEDDKCFGVTGALGWFVCPIIEAASNILETAYDDLIKPIVSVSPGIVDALSTSGSSDGGNGIYMAWGLFRNIANIAFIIMFLVVIFSQLTGIGIDNYGIKRTLPRLIVTAVLVNFSFLICQLAVDISNILGQGLEDMLVNLGNQITGADAVLNAMAEGSSGAHSAGWKTVGGLLGGLAMSAGAGFGAFMVSGTAFWGPLLLALGSAVIAIVFGFILLGVRQAIIVILVVTSPIAFILYALPNTNNLFKRWGKMFIDLLLVFPAAGLLIGGGFFTSRLLISVGGDSIIFQLIAMLLLCVPYFLIIPLVRSSLSAFGNIGAQIQNLGRNVSKGAAGAIRNSDAYKAWQTEARTAGTKGIRGRFAKTAVGRRLGFTRNLARQNEALDDMQDKDRKAMAYLNKASGEFRTNPELAADVEAALGGNGEDANVALETFAAQDMKGAADWASNYVSGLDANDENDRKKIESIAKFMANNDKFDQQLRRRDKTAYEYVARRGITGGDAKNGYTYGNIHNAAFGEDQTMDDRATQNATALRRDAIDGKFTQELAQQMVAENAPPAIRTGIASDKGKRRILDTVAAVAPEPITSKGERVQVNPMQVALDSQAKGTTALSINGGSTTITDASGNAIQGYMPSSGFTMDGQTQAYKLRGSGDVILVDSNGAYWNATRGAFADAGAVGSLNSQNATKLNT